MNCKICEKAVSDNEDRVITGKAGYHLRCWAHAIAEEIENNALAFNIVGKDYTARQVFEKTLPVAVT